MSDQKNCLAQHVIHCLIMLFLLSGCQTNPWTKRSQFISISRSQEFSLGHNLYQEILKKEPRSTHTIETAAVKRISRRITAAADRLMAQNNIASDFNWEVTVIKKDDIANAFCLPGGKIGVYTGLFKAAYDEKGLAIIIGHEVAHAMARHGAERLSQNQLFQLGQLALQTSTRNLSPQTISLSKQIYGITAQYGVALPYSRSHETDADQLGLKLAAMAGYDPAASIAVWQRMGEQNASNRPLEILSTHPAPSTRIDNMRRWLPDAQRLYRQAPKAPKADQRLTIIPAPKKKSR